MHPTDAAAYDWHTRPATRLDRAIAQAEAAGITDLRDTYKANA